MRKTYTHRYASTVAWGVRHQVRRVFRDPNACNLRTNSTLAQSVQDVSSFFRRKVGPHIRIDQDLLSRDVYKSEKSLPQLALLSLSMRKAIQERNCTRLKICVETGDIEAASAILQHLIDLRLNFGTPTLSAMKQATDLGASAHIGPKHLERLTYTDTQPRDGSNVTAGMVGAQHDSRYTAVAHKNHVVDAWKALEQTLDPHSGEVRQHPNIVQKTNTIAPVQSIGLTGGLRARANGQELTAYNEYLIHAIRRQERDMVLALLIVMRLVKVAYDFTTHEHIRTACTSGLLGSAPDADARVPETYTYHTDAHVDGGECLSDTTHVLVAHALKWDHSAVTHDLNPKTPISNLWGWLGAGAFGAGRVGKATSGGDKCVYIPSNTLLPELGTLLRARMEYVSITESNTKNNGETKGVDSILVEAIPDANRVYVSTEALAKAARCGVTALRDRYESVIRSFMLSRSELKGAVLAKAVNRACALDTLSLEHDTTPTKNAQLKAARIARDNFDKAYDGMIGGARHVLLATLEMGLKKRSKDIVLGSLLRLIPTNSDYSSHAYKAQLVHLVHTPERMDLLEPHLTTLQASDMMANENASLAERLRSIHARAVDESMRHPIDSELYNLDQRTQKTICAEEPLVAKQLKQRTLRGQLWKDFVRNVDIANARPSVRVSDTYEEPHETDKSIVSHFKAMHSGSLGKWLAAKLNLWAPTVGGAVYPNTGDNTAGESGSVRDVVTRHAWARKQVAHECETLLKRCLRLMDVDGALTVAHHIAVNKLWVSDEMKDYIETARTKRMLNYHGRLQREVDVRKGKGRVSEREIVLYNHMIESATIVSAKWWWERFPEQRRLDLHGHTRLMCNVAFAKLLNTMLSMYNAHVLEHTRRYKATTPCICVPDIAVGAEAHSLLANDSSLEAFSTTITGESAPPFNCRVVLITGKGSNSREGPVLRPNLMRLALQLNPPIKMVELSSASVELVADDVRQWLIRNAG
ncbi:hypothetical protein SARC_01544 [Sphaeroforma arctica JP610]|uniref:Smr domain-containing protein n=1 Tax=Sphaeroforma arctica JP610 TaxID=667725 RepID=A0A0L0GB86_9EUKA|nr:hypothetical protein SARC_01544 [Sphaeroforma arctica JP610]KNC86282.1 hypothetical protein SARC_01544 [Sphaeroforma arctica JP610]|eukprot:XP_014160184.1 hypothetical protein SARC_01544 [Sphaeroforma arctica JP610]